jgi:hypothetical protein
MTKGMQCCAVGMEGKRCRASHKGKNGWAFGASHLQKPPHGVAAVVAGVAAAVEQVGDEPVSESFCKAHEHVPARQRDT